MTKGATPLETLAHVCSQEAVPPRQLQPGVPRDLETVCLKCLQKDRARRYASARELAEDLRRFLAGEPILARPVGYAGRLARWCRRYPLAVCLFLAILFASSAAVLYLARLSEEHIRETALGSARAEAAMLDENWRFYSQRVDALSYKKTKVRFTEDYAKDDTAMPLPATYAIE